MPAPERKLYLGGRLRRLQARARAQPERDGGRDRRLALLSQPSRAQPAAGDRAGAAAACRSLRRRPSSLRRGGRRTGTGRRPARRDLRRPDVRRHRHPALRAARGRRQRARRSPTPSRGSTPPWSSGGSIRPGAVPDETLAGHAARPGCATISRRSATISPIIEEAAETLAGALGDPRGDLRARCAGGSGRGSGSRPGWCRPKCSTPPARHYDFHRKRLMLSALLRPESRTFGAAYQLALVEFGPMLNRMVETAGAARRADPAPAPHEPRQLRRRARS